MKILHEAQKAQQVREMEKPWILAAARRNGWLHYRPDFLKNKLVDCADQEWAADKPEGSYRFPSRWLEEREAHLNASFLHVVIHYIVCLHSFSKSNDRK